nr:MAG TPA: hypothetical protein [Caudoviricetes sp.]
MSRCSIISLSPFQQLEQFHLANHFASGLILITI